MKLEVEHNYKRITFVSKEANIYGYTEYTSKLWSKIKDLNWYISDKDLKNGERTYIYTGSGKAYTARYKKLYEIVMCSWYGKEKVDQMRDNKFIIEHMDNNPHNCSIENLSFAHEDLNKTKAFSLDKDRPAILDKVAMNIFKNFDNQDFEITLGFNDFYFFRYEEKGQLRYKPLTAMYLRYKDDFRTMLMEANSLVSKIMNNSTIWLANLECYEYRYDTANFISPPEGMEVKDLPSIFVHNDVPYMVLSDKNRLFSVGPSWREKHFKLNTINTNN